MTGLLKLLRYSKPYLPQVVLSIMSNIFLSIFTVVSIPLVIPFFQILFERTPSVISSPQGYNVAEWLEYGFSSLIANTDRSAALLYVCLTIVIVFLLKNLFRYLALFFMAPVRNGIVRDIRNKLYNSFLYLPISFHIDHQKGDLISRAVADVQEIEWSILNVVEAIFKSPLIIIGSIALMVYISPELTQFVFVLILFTTIIIGGIGRTLKKSSKAAQTSIGKITSSIDETLGGVKIIKAFGAEDFLKGKFHHENSHYKNILTKILRRRDMSSPLTEFLGIAVVAILLYYGSTLVFDGVLNPEAFFAFIFAFYQVIEPSKSFSSAYYNIQKGLAAMERVEDIIDEPIEQNEEKIKKSSFDRQIEFKDVSFKYPGTNNLVLNNVGLSIKKGEKIAIVGSSGSGKTTLIDLMLGFYHPSSGSIKIDDINSDELNRESLSSIFGLVTQSPVLFNDSVRNNIRFGFEKLVKTVEEASRIAFAEDFILQLPNGFDTNIGDSGVKLSGGQRQRLTLARAILRDPPILVLDEATSALDSESETLVQLALEEILKDRTAIIIAHRLSTIKNVDRIIVMKEGAISEAGTHDELIQLNGDYNKFVIMQNFMT